MKIKKNRKIYQTEISALPITEEKKRIKIKKFTSGELKKYALRISVILKIRKGGIFRKSISFQRCTL